MKTYTQNDLNEKLSQLRNRAVIHCRFTRELAGGQPAGDDALKAFIEHHLGLIPNSAEFNQAFERIKKEEIGERDTTPEEGEIKTEAVYAVNVIRRSGAGPYLLEHMIKACLKSAATRIGLSTAKRGIKGDLTHFTSVYACGDSLQKPDRPWEIYLRLNGQASPTSYRAIPGCVSGPQGKRSIVNHHEITPEGTEIAFELHWPKAKTEKGPTLTPDDVATLLAAATVIGLGSCLAIGYGRFDVVEIQLLD